MHQNDLKGFWEDVSLILGPFCSHFIFEFCKFADGSQVSFNTLLGLLFVKFVEPKAREFK